VLRLPAFLENPLCFFCHNMHILVRVALPAAAAQREQQRSGGGRSGSSSGSADGDAPPSTSSPSSPRSHRLFAVDFGSSSPPPLTLSSVAERALREAGHPDARGALESGEWRAVLEAAAGGCERSLSPAASLLLCVAPRALCLRGGKGGFGSLLRASGRVSKVTDQGACRDLSGRRVKAVEQERERAAWLAAAPARAEAEAAAKKAAEERRKREREAVAREAEASVDTEALKEAQERAARETAAAVAEAEGKREERGGGGGGGAAEEEEEEEGGDQREQQPSRNNENGKKKKKKKKSALDALAGLSGDESDDESDDD